MRHDRRRESLLSYVHEPRRRDGTPHEVCHTTSESPGLRTLIGNRCLIHKGAVSTSDHGPQAQPPVGSPLAQPAPPAPALLPTSALVFSSMVSKPGTTRLQPMRHTSLYALTRGSQSVEIRIFHRFFAEPRGSVVRTPARCTFVQAIAWMNPPRAIDSALAGDP